MDVTNITKKFTKISPQLGQISYNSTNEQITEVLDKVVEVVDSLEEYQVCQKELEFTQAKIEYWLKKVKEINNPISNIFNMSKTEELNDLQNNISEYLKQDKKALFRKRK